MSEAFEVVTDKSGRTVVRFAEHVVIRSAEGDKQLTGLISKASSLVLDLSKTKTLASEWMRFFVRLTEIAEQAGGRVDLLNMSEGLRKTEDYLALKGKLHHTKE